MSYDIKIHYTGDANGHVHNPSYFNKYKDLEWTLKVEKFGNAKGRDALIRVCVNGDDSIAVFRCGKRILKAIQEAITH